MIFRCRLNADCGNFIIFVFLNISKVFNFGKIKPILKTIRNLHYFRLQKLFCYFNNKPNLFQKDIIYENFFDLERKTYKGIKTDCFEQGFCTDKRDIQWLY